MVKDPDKWLALRLSAMGDVALTTGVLDWWGRTRGLSFGYVTREQWAPLLERHPAVDPEAVEPLGPGQLKGPAWLATARDLARKYRGWGLLDLHGTLRSRILAALWQGPVRRYPKFTLERRLYLRFRGPRSRQRLFALNVTQRYALALEARPPGRGELLPRVFLAPEELSAAAERLKPLRESGAPLIALHPYATHPDKAWPAAKWAALAQELAGRGMQWFTVGRGELLPGLEQGGRSLVNATTLRETCGLLAQADALVTGDSGPMHLAAAVGTPVLALFGPTDRAWGFFPAGPRDLVLERAMDCRPCSLHGKRPCLRGRRCLEDIGVDEAAQALASMVDPARDAAAKDRGVDMAAQP